MSTRRLLGALALVGALSACGADPADERRARVAAVTEAANDRDAGAVRERADDLLALVQAQRDGGQLGAAEADRLVALARSVRTSADVIDAELLERRRVEEEAEATRQELEQARKQLEEQRKKAEEAAREVEERLKGDEGKGDEGKGEDEKKDEGKDDD